MTDLGSLEAVRAVEAGELNPESLASDWRLEPTAFAWPGRTAGMTVATFGGPGAPAFEGASRPDPRTHILAVSTCDHHAELLLDRQLVGRGAFPRGMVQLGPAGRTPEVRFSAGWGVIHIYMPAADIVLLAEDLEVATADAANLSFTGLDFAREPILSGFALSLERRMRRREFLCRLELDEIALALGERMVRSHAAVEVPPPAEQPSLSAQERQALAELLADSHDPGLADLAQLLDRPSCEVERAFWSAFRAAPYQVRESFRKGRPV